MIGAILGRGVMRVVLIISALGAIGVGLLALNIDVLSMVGNKMNSLVRPLQVIVGLCGAASLIESVVGCCCHKQ